MKNLYDRIEETASYIKAKTDIKPTIGLILGSGLGVLADEIENPVKISYNEIPNFPVSTVENCEEELFRVCKSFRWCWNRKNCCGNARKIPLL